LKCINFAIQLSDGGSQWSHKYSRSPPGKNVPVFLNKFQTHKRLFMAESVEKLLLIIILKRDSVCLMV